jgi:predicted nucleotidyltransferase
MEDKKVLLNGKLSNDDYVIVSLAKSLTKINFDYKNKFLFIPRLENVSGTIIREKVSNKQFDDLHNMLPQETIDMLKNEVKLGHAPLHELRADNFILNNVNTLNKEELSNLTLIDENSVQNILNNRPFNNIDDVYNKITHGFSSHKKNRVLSVLEAGIFKEDVHKYISNYPQKIKVLGYKNKEVLKKFKDNLKNNLVGDYGKICQ